jgi:hypothetical protein
MLEREWQRWLATVAHSQKQAALICISLTGSSTTLGPSFRPTSDPPTPHSRALPPAVASSGCWSMSGRTSLVALPNLWLLRSWTSGAR